MTKFSNISEALRNAAESLIKCEQCNVAVSIYADDIVLGVAPAVVVCEQCAADLELIELDDADGKVIR